MTDRIKAVLLDFGGVLAEEGFREGLRAIGARNGLDPDGFFAAADRIIYETGYLTGNADEASFWSALRQETGVAGSYDELRREILRRFVIRPEVLAFADLFRSRGLVVAMLSDQTNWLEEIDAVTPIFRHFDAVFNSFRIHKSKRDPSLFRDVCASLNVRPEEMLFVDDNNDHIDRAAGEGLNVIHFRDVESFKREIVRFIPDLDRRNQDL
jgi:putative hydrolase of the HAD superfamily